MAVNRNLDFMFCTRPTVGLPAFGLGHNSPAEQPDGVFRFQTGAPGTTGTADQQAVEHQRSYHGLDMLLTDLLQSGLIAVQIGTSNYGVRLGRVTGFYFPGTSVSGRCQDPSGDL